MSVAEHVLDGFCSQFMLGAEDSAALLALPVALEQIDIRYNTMCEYEVGSDIILMVDGLAARSSVMMNGSRQITALHLPGDLLYFSEITASVTSASVHMLTASSVARIPRTAFDLMLLQHPRITHAFFQKSMVDTAIMDRWLVNIGRKAAIARLGHFLCEMAARYARRLPVDGTEVLLPMTQEQIGDTLGLTSVHVNRSLKALRDRQIIAVNGRTITFLDMRAMTRIAEFDSGYLNLRT